MKRLSGDGVIAGRICDIVNYIKRRTIKEKYMADSSKDSNDKLTAAKVAGCVVGGFSGAMTGSTIGAAIGSVFGPLGTASGFTVGGKLGALLGGASGAMNPGGAVVSAATGAVMTTLPAPTPPSQVL